MTHKTKTIGLTGGIGSGKSTVAKQFEKLGIPVYYSDLEARKFLNDKQFIIKMISRWGNNVVSNNEVNRKFIASIIFNDDIELKWMNDEMHPLIKNDYQEWLNKQETKYVIQESAILFESGSNEIFDYIITVSADINQRLERSMKRDNANEEEIKSRMSKQWDDSMRNKYSDFIILNNDEDDIIPQINKIHLILNS
jgi:dephospho-CoA kinase